MPRRQGYKFYNTTALENNSIIPQQHSDTATAVTEIQRSKYRIKECPNLELFCSALFN